jgi:hypothetical protein
MCLLLDDKFNSSFDLFTAHNREHYDMGMRVGQWKD